MAAFNKFDSFLEACFEKKHNFSSDTFKVVLSNTAPVRTNTQLSNITQISAGNGYTTGGSTLTISASSQTNGTYTAALSTDVVFAASGGTIGPFRYVTVYNDTASNDELVSYYDRGSALTLADGETFTIDVGASLFTAV